MDVTRSARTNTRAASTAVVWGSSENTKVLSVYIFRRQICSFMRKESNRDIILRNAVKFACAPPIGHTTHRCGVCLQPSFGYAGRMSYWIRLYPPVSTCDIASLIRHILRSIAAGLPGFCVVRTLSSSTSSRGLYTIHPSVTHTARLVHTSR